MDNQPPLKPNILALPTQTFTIFLLIVFSLLGSVLLGSLDIGPIPIWPLALALWLLPLRAFLSQPEREINRYKLQPAGDEWLALKQEITALSNRIELDRIPKLLIGEDNTPLYTFGTFRHQYLAMSYQRASYLQEQLKNPERCQATQAIILHELFHFKTGDYWQLGYVEELIRYTFWIMIWGMLFFGGIGVLLILSTPTLLEFNPSEFVGQIEGLTPPQRQLLLQTLPSPEELAAVRQKATTINLPLMLLFVLNATLPFIVLSTVLWLLYWPKLWRIRELYADAGVVVQQGSQALMFGLLFFSRLNSVSLAKPSLFNNIHKLPEKFRQISGRLMPEHPDSKHRLKCLQDPRQVFDNWLRTAFWVGSLALLLDILLSSPLTLLYTGNWPMHFSTLVILVIISLTLIPQLALGYSVWADMLKIVGVIILLRLAWLLITIGILILLLIIAPDMLAEVLASGVASIAHFAGYSDNLGFDNLPGFVLTASILNLAQVFIIGLVLIGGLSLNILLLRRLFTWYKLPNARKNLIKVAYGIITVTTLLIALSILPISTVLLLQGLVDWPGLFSYMMWCMGGGIALTGLICFIYADHKYGRHCPNSDHPIKDQYYLGKRCPECHQYLHPWLIANLSHKHAKI